MVQSGFIDYQSFKWASRHAKLAYEEKAAEKHNCINSGLQIPTTTTTISSKTVTFVNLSPDEVDITRTNIVNSISSSIRSSQQSSLSSKTLRDGNTIRKPTDYKVNLGGDCIYSREAAEEYFKDRNNVLLVPSFAKCSNCNLLISGHNTEDRYIELQHQDPDLNFISLQQYKTESRLDKIK